MSPVERRDAAIRAMRAEVTRLERELAKAEVARTLLKLGHGPVVARTLAHDKLPDTKNS